MEERLWLINGDMGSRVSDGECQVHFPDYEVLKDHKVQEFWNSLSPCE
jgi:hypothetical protein